MRRLPWLLPLGLVVVGCLWWVCRERRDDHPAVDGHAVLKKALMVDVTKGPVSISKGSTGDRIVRVSAPSTVYVLQNGQVLFAVYWRHQRDGTVTVPLDAISDGEHPLTIGMEPGPIQDDPNLIWRAAPNCIDCLRGALYKCCLPE